jgi:hypothetical protein
LPAFSNAFVTSQEYFQDQVNAYYQKYLGRAADSGALTSDVNTLLAGQTTDEKIIAGLVASDEYFMNHSSDDLTFLQGAYQDVLGRPLDSSGQSTWLPYLQNGGSRLFVATQLVTSQEYRTNLASGFYTNLLGRTGSPSEVAGWVSALGNGTTDEQAINTFVSSVEYFQGAALGGNTNVSWFTSLYQKLLGRAPDTSGLNSNVDGLLADYAPQRQLDILTIINSDEYLTDKINGFYLKYLGRKADPGALSSDIANLRSGRITDESLIAGLVGSPEYFANHGSDNLTFLQGAYQDVLGQPLDPSGQSTWLTYLNNGGSRTFVAIQLVTSTVYRTNLISSYYTTYLGRPGSTGDVAGWVMNLANGMTDEQVLTAFLLSDEYFLKTHPFPPPH